MIDNQNKMEEAKKQHLAAFKKLLIGALYWVKTCAVKSLNKIYTKSLSKTDFTDNNYRSENLKLKSKIAANVKPVYHLQSLENLNQVSSTIAKCLLKN